MQGGVRGPPPASNRRRREPTATPFLTQLYASEPPRSAPHPAEPCSSLTLTCDGAFVCAAVVDDPRTNAICSWNEVVAMDGVPPGGVHAFTVHDNGALEKDVLPTFYNHSNFTSFIRQLNQYSFR